METIVQNIQASVKSDFDMAFKYFTIISIINNLHLVKRDLQLLAFSAAEKQSVNLCKKDFCKKFGTSMATVGNIISKLYKCKVLIKDKKTVEINPLLLQNFENNFEIKLNLKHNGDKG